VIPGSDVAMSAGTAGIRFERVELRYGRHTRGFVLLPAAGPGTASGTSNGGGTGGRGRPFVILGPNAAGKTTLLEGIVRTVFGFRRTRKEDRDTHDRRRPWPGGGYEGSVTVGTPQGRFMFVRDFDSDLVRVTKVGETTPLFESEANPARAGETIRRYRDLLSEIVGLSELDDYRRTACISQGGLLGTDLSVDLLRVAAGGHADVETAHESIAREYRELTVQPIAPGASRRRKPGLLEQLAESVAELDARVGEARSGEERRAPLVRARNDLRRRMAGLGDEVAKLERAFETLSEAERLETEVEAGRTLIRGVESAGRELDEALARFELMADQERVRAADPAYPLDFYERARLLEGGLWPRSRAIEAELASLAGEGEGDANEAGWLARTNLPSIGGGVASGLGLVSIALGATALGVAIFALGAAVVLAARSSRNGARLRVEYRGRRVAALVEERREIAGRIEELLDGVPEAASVGPETLPSHRREFERQAADRRLMAEAETGLRSAIDVARRSLAQTRRINAADEDESDEAAPGATSPRGLPDRAREILRHLHDRASTEREERVGPALRRLNEISRDRFDLPDAVVQTGEGVRNARRQRLARMEEVRGELALIERDLAVGTPGESALALERERDARLERLRSVEARARAYRAANALVATAYEAFRRTDEERLVSAISGHLDRLSGGTLGPLEAAGGLDEARVRAGERALEMDAPPLSYGQLHAALFAVRLGAADFLAGLGVGLPLLIDDPFVHLDEHTAADLWDVLERVARDRQVVIATQDRLVLRHLGVSPDLELEARVACPSAEPAAPAAGAEPPERAEPELRAENTAPIDRAGATPGSRSESAPADTGDTSPMLDLWGHSDA